MKKGLQQYEGQTLTFTATFRRLGNSHPEHACVNDLKLGNSTLASHVWVNEWPSNIRPEQGDVVEFTGLVEAYTKRRLTKRRSGRPKKISTQDYQVVEITDVRIVE